MRRREGKFMIRKNTTNRHADFLSLGLVFGLWLVLVLACGSPKQSTPSGSASPPPTTETPAAPPIAITALALARAYEDNEVAADGKYEGKVLVVSGTVESIDTVFGTTSVTLKGKNMSIVSVQCFFDDSHKGAIANLKKGQKITVQGTCDGKSLNVHLKDCAIIPNRGV